MKIAVVGNCQGESLTLCLQAMNPNLEVEFVPVAKLRNGSRVARDLLQHNHFTFVQPALASELGDEFADRIHLFPAIVFPAFHPDQVYLSGVGHAGVFEEMIGSPLVTYHSAIAVFCYVHKISVDEALNWYNPFVFGRFGYLDKWGEAKAALLAQGEAANLPLGELFNKWARGGNFMSTMNHPRLDVMEDVARKLLERTGLPIINNNVADYLNDPLKNYTVWPVYPAIGERLGLQGDYNFKNHSNNPTLTLRDFVQQSYAIYDGYDPASFEPFDLSVAEMGARISLPTGVTADAPRNPYASARPVQFWKNSVAGVPAAALDPVVDPLFTIGKTDKIATAGSCFAQHVARTLAKSGFNYFVPEGAPEGMDPAEAKDRNYDVYSSRYGNVYTVRQLLQLILRAEGRFHPMDDVWTRRDGKLVDPFRPQIEPDGFESPEALKASREVHFAAVRRMIREMDVFVFTLGLTEGWRSRYDGAVFPLAPGVAGGVTDFDIYEFVNFTPEETNADLDKVIDLIKAINPSCRIILTVSPVPLIATYEPRHALVATTYSKSVLRVSAEYARRAYDHVEYFPSYEIITGSYNKGAYYAEDQREVVEEGVSHVMSVLMRHYADTEPSTTKGRAADLPASPAQAPKKKSLFDVVCDEEAILKF